MPLTCFKAYDIRGKLSEELNEDIAYRIGCAYAQHFSATRVVVGCDARLSSDSLKQALARGLTDSGANVIDIGMVGTEEVYFATYHWDVDGGIEVTASHNPKDYNGMKLVGRDAAPISGESGLKAIKELVANDQFLLAGRQGEIVKKSILKPYVDHLMTYIDPAPNRPFTLVVNAGNGAAGHVIDEIEKRFRQHNFPVKFIKLHHEPDGSFPNGIPNPLLPENRAPTAEAVIAHKADMGIAWDGDFDRCFFFDENGKFIEGYYIVGLLAEVFLSRSAGEKIIHDPRLTWNTIDVVQRAGGITIQSQTGHTFIKERMRAENAVYGGEMSAHHYFRDFGYCDSGMIPWLLVLCLLSKKQMPFSNLVIKSVAAYPCSGERNYYVTNAADTIRRIKHHYINQALSINLTDGLSMTFENWRFNVRTSNTEPLLRLNIETRADPILINSCVLKLEALIFQK